LRSTSDQKPDQKKQDPQPDPNKVPSWDKTKPLPDDPSKLGSGTCILSTKTLESNPPQVSAAQTVNADANQGQNAISDQVPAPKNPDGTSETPTRASAWCAKLRLEVVAGCWQPPGGTWTPNDWKGPGSPPSASWEPGQDAKPGHWDVDNGKGKKNGGRQRYDEDGKPITDGQAHASSSVASRASNFVHAHPVATGVVACVAIVGAAAAILFSGGAAGPPLAAAAAAF
jgi:hypothetical protein